MSYNFKRKNIRLKNYDYSTKGCYFITICTKNKEKYFGNILNDKMYFNNIGNIVYKNIANIKTIYSNILIDKFVIMPNHIHMILIINKETDLTISRIIKQFKEKITKNIGESIWQQSYYDHIIRNRKDYERIAKYIEENVLKWSFDKYFDS